jgi:hypothetical protein
MIHRLLTNSYFILAGAVLLAALTIILAGEAWPSPLEVWT